MNVIAEYDKASKDFDKQLALVDKKRAALSEARESLATEKDKLDELGALVNGLKPAAERARANAARAAAE